jgi:hypothetical protein
MGWVSSLTALIARALSGPQSFPGDAVVDGGGGGGGLNTAWRSWLEMPHTDEQARPAINSTVDLPDLDHRIAEIFQSYFHDGELSPGARDELAQCQMTLALIVPTLSGEDRQYFAMASSIARAILDSAAAEREPDQAV